MGHREERLGVSVQHRAAATHRRDRDSVPRFPDPLELRDQEALARPERELRGYEEQIHVDGPARGQRAFRARIGVVLQQAEPFFNLTVRETHAIFARYYPHPRDVDETIRLVGLEEKRDALAKTLSGGQKRRLDLGVALVGDPDLIFLDEPTTGFDPAARRAAWEMVRSLRSLGKTILLTTHYLDEAEHLSDRVVVIDHGHVLAEGTPDELAARAGSATVISFRLPQGFTAADVPDVGSDRRVAGNVVELRTVTPTADVAALAQWALGRTCELDALTLSRPSLEDVYLDLVGEGADTAEPAREEAGR